MRTATYQVTGMDCPSCVAKIEKAAHATQGVGSVRVSLAAQTMIVTGDDDTRWPQIESAVRDLGYRLAPLNDAGTPLGSHDDDQPRDVSRVSAAYRRALWIVIGLNVGYGVVEIVGGFLAGSQAVKADALDFLGDGFISFLGVIAIGWRIAWRSRAALMQGFFLAALGLGVLGNTIHRMIVQQAPEAGLMGLFGLIALIVNVGAVAVLLPHRAGDANIRAVWLFSRNDAIGNAAVIVAAGLVAWTGSPWPDLVVAIGIASLFLQSAWAIIRDSLRELSPRNFATR